VEPTGLFAKKSKIIEPIAEGETITGIIIAASIVLLKGPLIVVNVKATGTEKINTSIDENIDVISESIRDSTSRFNSTVSTLKRLSQRIIRGDVNTSRRIKTTSPVRYFRTLSLIVITVLTLLHLANIF
jgi:hypothetical protein